MSEDQWQRPKPANAETDEETQLLRRALLENAARRVGQELRAQAVLEVHDIDGDLLSLVPIPAEGLTIGRGADQDVRLADRTVSRRHARIEVVDGRYYVDDAGSLNDTLLNGELVRGRAELHDGDQLTIGLHVLIVSIR